MFHSKQGLTYISFSELFEMADLLRPVRDFHVELTELVFLRVLKSQSRVRNKSSKNKKMEMMKMMMMMMMMFIRM
jgi:hypothetical protein